MLPKPPLPLPPTHPPSTGQRQIPLNRLNRAPQLRYLRLERADIPPQRCELLRQIVHQRPLHARHHLRQVTRLQRLHGVAAGDEAPGADPDDQQRDRQARDRELQPADREEQGAGLLRVLGGADGGR